MEANVSVRLIRSVFAGRFRSTHLLTVRYPYQIACVVQRNSRIDQVAQIVRTPARRNQVDVRSR
jgi:hypothetical protein